MYLLEICSDDAVYPEARRFRVERNDERLRKWALLPAGPGSRELLGLAALACCGYPFVRRLAADPGDLAGRHGSGLRVGYVLARHAPFDGRAQCPGIAAGGLRILPTAAGLDVHPDLDAIATPDVPRLQPALGAAYGPCSPWPWVRAWGRIAAATIFTSMTRGSAPRATRRCSTLADRKSTRLNSSHT